MSFSWPVSGSVAAADANSSVLGWQYQINSTSGTWLGTTTGVGLNYIATGSASYTLTAGQDGGTITTPGNYIVYFRTADGAGNVSTDATVRTCNLSYGGQAPSFGGSDTVTVTPATSTGNSYALSWPTASAAHPHAIAHYYYIDKPAAALNTCYLTKQTVQPILIMEQVPLSRPGHFLM